MPEKHEIPLLYYHHTHTEFYMILRNCFDLRSVSSFNKAITIIEEFIKEFCIDSVSLDKVSFDIKDNKIHNLQTILY